MTRDGQTPPARPREDPDLDREWVAGPQPPGRLVRGGPRDLPWRADRDAYRILVSEMMLVQTTVAAVVPYFERFLGRFPTVRALAEADEADVLKAWEGLGYYRGPASSTRRPARSSPTTAG